MSWHRYVSQQLTLARSLYTNRRWNHSLNSSTERGYLFSFLAMAQVQVHVIPADRAGNFGAAKPARFGDSLFTQLGLDSSGRKSMSKYAEYAQVYIGEKQIQGENKLFVSLSPFENADHVPLGRAAHIPESGSVLCPCVELAERGVRLKPKYKHMKVGVVVALKDEVGRRLAHLSVCSVLKLKLRCSA